MGNLILARQYIFQDTSWVSNCPQLLRLTNGSQGCGLLQGQQFFLFEEGFGAGAGLWVVEAGFAEGTQEGYAAFAHFVLPVFERVFEGGVVAGAGGFAHLAGLALHGEVFGTQDAVAEGVDGPGGNERAHGFDEVAGEGFAAVRDAVVVADAGVESDEVDVAHHGVVQQGVAEREADVVRVARRVAVAFCEVEAFRQDAGDGGKGGVGGAAFDAAQGSEVGDGGFELATAVFELFEAFVQAVAAAVWAGL